MRPIESCLNLSPNVNLMSCVTFSPRSQPLCVPIELENITLSHHLPNTIGTLYQGHCIMPHAPQQAQCKTVKMLNYIFISNFVYYGHSLRLAPCLSYVHVSCKHLCVCVRGDALH